ncbi:immunity 49 family protein [Streptomyces violens]|uniref:immunity 49 family protein n=1 Tax=Streptomyces violens TaxID=66377 RepID=UPI0004C01BBA|nr:immunity 49 family protein [Streptomyces violens]
MAIIVPRHAFPLEGAETRAEKLDNSARRKIGSLERSPANFNMALGTSLLAAQTHCAHDPRAAMLPTWEAWVTAMQVGSALFAAATTSDETVQCRIADEMRTIPATGPQHYTDAGNWLTSFWLAVICREQERMTQLANVPISLLRASGAVFDEYVYSWVEALQVTWREGGDLGELLTAAMNGTHPDSLRVADPDLVLKTLYPPINLFTRYIMREPGQFNEALSDAVRWHKEYWSEDEERSNSSAGLVALAPLALACLAYDAGFPIEVESEYLPKHLLHRTWLNEFDT